MKIGNFWRKSMHQPISLSFSPLSFPLVFPHSEARSRRKFFGRVFMQFYAKSWVPPCFSTFCNKGGLKDMGWSGYITIEPPLHRNPRLISGDRFWEGAFSLSRKISTFLVYIVCSKMRVSLGKQYKKVSNLFKKHCFFAPAARQNLSFYVLLSFKI